MFILNAICCVSDPPSQPSASRNNIVKKPVSPSSNPSIKIPSSDNSNLQIKTTQENSFSTSPEHTPTFPMLATTTQYLQSDECNPTSDRLSLEEQLSNNFVSPLEEPINQKPHKTLTLAPFRQQSFSGWDLNDTQIKQWSIKDVLNLLVKIGLKRYHSTFYENKIKGKDLVTLSEKQLREDLKMSEQDIRTMNVYIQLLKEKSQRQAREKGLSRTFGGQRKSLSLYKYHSNTYSCRKILQMVKDPIMEEECEQEIGQKYGRKQNMTTKDFYSSSNFSELMTK